MTRLKCLNCGSVFDKRALVAFAGAGPTYACVGIGGGPIIWPLALRVYAECPNCKQKGWIKVLSPWSKEQVQAKDEEGEKSK